MDFLISTSTISVMDLMNLSKDLAEVNAAYLSIALTALLVINGVIGGLFVYFNINPLRKTLDKQEDKIDKVKEDAQNILSLSRSESEKKLSEFKNDLTMSFSNITKVQNEKLISQVSSRVATFDRDLAIRIGDITRQKYEDLKDILLSEIKKQIAESEKNISTDMAKIKKELETDINSVKTSLNINVATIKNIERKIKELELEEFARKKQMGAIYRAVELLKEDIDSSGQVRIPDSLEKLKVQIGGVKLKPEVIVLIEEQLVKLKDKPQYNLLITNIRSEYNDKIEKPN